ncbi:MAG TPA: tyrosine-type recombinase/integrase [Paludibacteraceae bacterium]|nr:tyrosine-type recombinase/integrase [Paludibacteraceae bacterium]
MVIMNEFLEYLRYERNYSPYTVLSYQTDLSQFIEFMHETPETFSPSQVTPQQIQQWIMLLMSEKKSARTLSRKISTLKSFWHFLLSRGYVAKNPVSNIILPKKSKPLPAFFKKEEMAAALEETFLTDDFEKLRNHLMLELFYFSGIRRSELISLRDSDVDFISRQLSVIGKRNKERIIPLNKKLCQDIRRYIQVRNKTIENKSQWLFVRKNGDKLYPKLVYNMVHQTMSAYSSQSKRSPHVIRHSFATHLLNEGADINAVKELLGHSSLAATQVYTHTSFEELYKIYKQSHPRGK